MHSLVLFGTYVENIIEYWINNNNNFFKLLGNSIPKIGRRMYKQNRKSNKGLF